MDVEKKDQRTISITEYVYPSSRKTRLTLRRTKGTRVIDLEFGDISTSVNLPDLQEALRSLEKW